VPGLEALAEAPLAKKMCFFQSFSAFFIFVTLRLSGKTGFYMS
jgi:hypothetical protein